MAHFRPVTLVTGASFGIGAELARAFAAAGHELVLASRSETQLTAVADAIVADGASRPHVIPIDLGRLDSCARLAHELATRGLEPRFVVNNAGFGLVGNAHELDRGEQLEMIDLNVRALTDLSLRWIDGMRAQGGGLLNVASVAGFLPAPGMAVYYATKAYVLSFTEALHVELAPLGVRVTALCPGPVRTGFQRRAGLRDEPASRLAEQTAKAVARAGYNGLMAGKRLVVPGLANKLATFVPRVLPRASVLRLTDARRRRRRREALAPPPWPRNR
jgi:short-subunit dehydrogenase